MTPQELHAALDEVRRAQGLAWWQVAVALDINASRLNEMRRGALSEALRGRALAWLERHTGPPRQE